MRKTLLTLALAIPFTLVGCAEETPAEEAREEMIEDGAPAGDMEDVIGDGEIIDEPGEIEPDSPNDDVMEDAIID
jgi:hypothetical protein